ncbi:MAG: carbohydrate ABC transporter permease [Bacteroidota bacterium]
MKNRRLREAANSITVYALIAVALVFMLTPIVWLLSTSLKDRNDMFSFPLHLIPKRFAWGNYAKIWQAIPFATYLRNSIVVAVYATFVAVGLSCFGAYAFSRFKFKGRDTSLRMILFSQMFPAVLLIIPIFIYIKNLGLLGTYTGLMITYLTFLVPFSTWALTNFFDTVPVDLEEAAMIDGCTRVGALFRVVLPVSLPGLVSVGTYCFLTSWNEFIFAMAFMSDQNHWTLPVGLSALTSQYALDWGLLTAGGIISLIPAVFIVLFLQRYLIAGLTAGAVKE